MGNTQQPPREIGGYFELDLYHGAEYHEKALALDCARNCLAYLIEARSIRTLWVPSFLCSSVDAVASKYDVVVHHYQISKDFLPDYQILKIENGEYLYLVDYYGQLTDAQIRQAEAFSEGRLIVDEVMAFFRKPLSGLDTIYSCRKFFGVSDGAYLYTDARIDRELTQDQSHDRMGFVLGRFELPANAYYRQASENNGSFSGRDIKLMSPLTHNLLRGVDYDWIAQVRQDNFKAVATRVDALNELSPVATRGAFSYPLLINNGADLRKKMQERKIYIPTLWPSAAERDGLASRLARDTLPLVIDQRYGLEDMAYQCDTLLEFLSE